MSESPQTANRVTRLYDLPSHSLPVDPRDRRDIGPDGLKRAPRLDGADVMPARLDLWPSSILAFFMEGFALYAASYHASPHAIAASPADTSRAEASAPQQEVVSWHARRRAMAIVSSAMHSGVPEFEDDINRAAPGSETASGDTSFDAGRSRAVVGRPSVGTPSQADGHRGAASVRSKRRSLPWWKPIAGHRGISASPTDLGSSRSRGTAVIADVINCAISNSARSCWA
jgi:hypothetical protein